MPSSTVINPKADLSTEQVPQDDPRSGVISIDPGRHSGSPCFVGTRVPVIDLWDFFSAGGSLDEFLDSFPSVRKEQALEVIRFAS
jgi:uncharacterized protein (DUF433 family)